MDTQVRAKLEGFFTQFKKRIYKKREIIIRADEDPSGVFYLKKGRVKQYVISKKGDELVVNIFKPVAYFPMSWAITNTPNEYYFEAISEVEVYKAPKELVVEYIKKEPDLLYNLLSRVYLGIDGTLKRMIYIMSGNAYTRLVTELIIYCNRFAEKETTNSKKITIKITEKDLAAQSGMSRETISREIKKLKNARLIERKKDMLVIPNLSALENELVRKI